MDSLLDLIAEIGDADDDDTVIRIGTVTTIGKGLELHLELSTFDLGENTRKIEVRCEEVLDYAVRNEVASSIILTSNHPLLWRFTYDTASAFFKGTPPDVYAATGALYEAHRHATDDWFGLETQLNGGLKLSQLLSAGNGLLARGPIPLLTAYKDVLSQYSVEVEIVGPYPPGGMMSSAEVQNRLRKESKALIVGDSYVAGIGWTAP
ncbi:hypothetical protein HDF16_005549 [Granulicella aggregans]|uniref:Uncharacterized protein n=1 Tax=Granulicella aggregans TaxID=474949 RepID=A0A7W8E642_9BACT|nr:hypothetical protein [Granulicella aggregans]MBB5060813.1 hypothetical protein [Granulicella aggregans]